MNDFRRLADLLDAGTDLVTALRLLSGVTTTLGDASKDYLNQVKVIPGNQAGDAFGRLRVSNPETIFDSKQVFDNQPLFWDESLTGTASATWSGNTASTLLDIKSTSTETAMRQTFMRFNYQPGKSQLVFMTGTLKYSGTSAAGLSRGWGYGDDNDGIFLQDLDGVVQLLKRSSTSGSPVDTTVAQASWNLDVMDGTGDSGVTIDWTKSQILVIDFEWLGVGRVRVGFNIDGVTYYVHEWKHANSLTGVYMSTPNLPLRYWITNDGTYASTAELEHICASVISEGGQNSNGALRYKSTAGTHIDCATENTMYVIMAGRIKSAYTGVSIKVVNISIMEQAGSKMFEWVLYANPTIGGGSLSYSAVTNSAMEVALGNGTLTASGGVEITGGFIATSNKGGSDSGQLENAILLGADISGTQDEFVLGVRPVGGSSAIDIEAAFTWRELI